MWYVEVMDDPILLSLQPENILLDSHLNIKVSDFGFATTCKPGETLSGIVIQVRMDAQEMLIRYVVHACMHQVLCCAVAQ